MNTTALLLALALFATGCVSLRSGDDPGLVGTWQLTSIGDDANAVSGASITFDADGRVSGSTGCNRFTGTYELEGDGDLDLSPLATTRMACAPAAQEQERRVLGALADVERAEVAGRQLVLWGDGRRLLAFEAATRTASDTATLTGTVTYLPRIALPPDAAVSVRLLDVSRADAPSETLAEQTISAEGRSVPIPFSLEFDADQIDARGRYVVRADVRDRAGALLWTTDTAVPVLTNGAPSFDVEVRLMQVTDETVGATVGALIGPTWRVHQIEQPSGAMITLDWRAPYTLRFEADGRYSGRIDCNRIGGAFEAHDDGALDLEPGLSTLAACPPGSASDDVLGVLAGVDRYTVGGDRLELIGEAGTLVLVRDDGNVGSPNPGALPGPEWQLVQIRSADGATAEPQGEGRFTVSFMSGGRFAGRADCNQYGGTFEADSNGDLVLTNTATTVAACAPPSSSRAFFGTINQVVGFGTADGRLTLRGADGSALVFERDAQGWMPSQETGRDVAYTCPALDGPFTFRIRTGPGEIALWLPERFRAREGGTYLVLGQVRAASGVKYQDGAVTVWTHQGEALLEVDGEEFRGCTAQT